MRVKKDFFVVGWAFPFRCMSRRKSCRIGQIRILKNPHKLLFVGILLGNIGPSEFAGGVREPFPPAFSAGKVPTSSVRTLLGRPVLGSSSVCCLSGCSSAVQTAIECLSWSCVGGWPCSAKALGKS